MRIDEEKISQEKLSTNSINLNANVNIKKRKAFLNVILSRSSRSSKKSRELHLEDFIDLLNDENAFSKDRSSTRKSNVDKNVEISILSESSQTFKKSKERRSVNVDVRFNLYEIDKEKDRDFDYNNESISDVEIDLKKK